MNCDRAELWPQLVKCLRHLQSLQPMGPISRDQKIDLDAARQRILSGAKLNSNGVRKLLQVYEDAYDSLLCGRDPRQFRKFLLDAPALFLDIGEKMGALSHITSFWNYRFPVGAPRAAHADELIVIFQDFSRGIAAEFAEAA